MKFTKIISVFLGVFLIVSSFSFVLAQEDTNSDTLLASLPLSYRLKLYAENIKLSLTTDRSARISLLNQIATARFQEFRAAVDARNIEAAKISAELYRQSANRLADELNQVYGTATPGKDLDVIINAELGISQRRILIDNFLVDFNQRADTPLDIHSDVVQIFKVMREQDNEIKGIIKERQDLIKESLKLLTGESEEEAKETIRRAEEAAQLPAVRSAQADIDLQAAKVTIDTLKTKIAQLQTGKDQPQEEVKKQILKAQEEWTREREELLKTIAELQQKAAKEAEAEEAVQKLVAGALEVKGTSPVTTPTTTSAKPVSSVPVARTPVGSTVESKLGISFVSQGGQTYAIATYKGQTTQIPIGDKGVIEVANAISVATGGKIDQRSVENILISNLQPGSPIQPGLKTIEQIAQTSIASGTTITVSESSTGTTTATSSTTSTSSPQASYSDAPVYSGSTAPFAGEGEPAPESVWVTGSFSRVVILPFILFTM